VNALALARPAGVVDDSVTVTVGTPVSRVRGFGCAATISAALGPTWFGNTHQATNSLRNIIGLHRGAAPTPCAESRWLHGELPPRWPVRYEKKAEPGP